MTLEDFKANIGKRIFRNDNRCTCLDCKRILEEGLIVTDENHAEYLYTIQNDLGCEGIELNYRTVL